MKIVQYHADFVFKISTRLEVASLSYLLPNTGWPKNLAHFCTPYNFITYWPRFKLISLSESGKICNKTSTKDPNTSNVSLHYL